MLDLEGNRVKRYTEEEVAQIFSCKSEIISVLIQMETGQVLLVQEDVSKTISLIEFDIKKEHQSMQFCFGACYFQVAREAASIDLFYFVRRDWTELSLN